MCEQLEYFKIKLIKLKQRKQINVLKHCEIINTLCEINIKSTRLQVTFHEIKRIFFYFVELGTGWAGLGTRKLSN